MAEREWEPIIDWESLNSDIAQYIHKQGWPIIQGRIAVAFGAGVIKENTKAVWTEDGRRVTCTLSSDGGMVIAQSKEPDPVFVESARTQRHPSTIMREEMEKAKKAERDKKEKNG